MKEQIAAELESAFSLYGFAQPSVAKLNQACSVSLRTLYKYFPSKEAMIVGALEHRHQRYLKHLTCDLATEPRKALEQIFERLEHWMETEAPNGCMSTNALTDFADNPEISQVVSEHKQQVRAYLASLCGCEQLGGAIFLIHEGASNAWPLMGKATIDIAKYTVNQLIKEK
ncbi:TetR/AcrR family transcriptional regulator [Vibrio sp. WXL103]|uniref:TetR/AcrR family transcriptional regulator n=1 Tax=Vibrio sp. WXL103 TaxID=3450710 RepID=UPI003EC7E08F